MNILLADDNDANCLIAQTILERAGHTVVTAQNGAHALEMTKLTVYDLIVLDILMPVMDGLQALQRIRGDVSKNQITPIFALTAFCDTEDRLRYVAAGFDAILSKPLRRGDLKRALSHYKDKSAPSLTASTYPCLSQHIPVLDDETVGLLTDYGTADRLLQIQSRFWSTIYDKCGIIKTALPAVLQGDEASLSEFRRAVHAIKGACDSIGLSRVAHISRNLRNAPPAEIIGLMHALISALSEGRPALKHALSGTRKLDAAVQMSGEDETEAPHHRQNNRSAVRY